jgi:30S ribosomal protein S31
MRGGVFYSITNNPELLTFKIKIMGRGDKKTAKGKRFKSSFGKSRPAKKAATKKAAAKKA